MFEGKNATEQPLRESHRRQTAICDCMSAESENDYAGRIGRSMWRLAKRRAFALATGAAAPSEDSVPLLPARAARLRPGATETPASLREFLRRLAEELEQDGPRSGAS